MGEGNSTRRERYREMVGGGGNIEEEPVSNPGIGSG